MIIEDIRGLTFAIETVRKENKQEHAEILSKLNTLCTKIAVSETKVETLTKTIDGDERNPGLTSRMDDAETTITKYGVYFALMAAAVTVGVIAVPWIIEHWR
jgi:hypothetical protein